MLILQNLLPQKFINPCPLMGRSKGFVKAYTINQIGRGGGGGVHILTQYGFNPWLSLHERLPKSGSQVPNCFLFLVIFTIICLHNSKSIHQFEIIFPHKVRSIYGLAILKVYLNLNFSLCILMTFLRHS